MKVFEIFNKQVLLSDLQKVDESILKSYKINSFDEIKPYFDKYELDINNLYLLKNGIFPQILYIDDYCSVDILLDLSVLDNDFFGLPKIKNKINIFKEEFEKENYDLIFHNDFNKMPLYHFLHLYKFINKEKVFSVFKTCYQSISYGFNLIPEEVLEYIFQFKPETDIVLKSINNSNITNIIYNENDYITIYRGQGTKSLDIKYSKSWTLSKEIADKFSNYGEGKTYIAQVKISNIIDYFDDSEYEVLVNFQDLINVKQI